MLEFFALHLLLLNVFRSGAVHRIRRQSGGRKGLLFGQNLPMDRLKKPADLESYS